MVSIYKDQSVYIGVLRTGALGVYKGMSGQLETVEHILKECPLHPLEREVLRKVSPELDLKILLDTKKALDAVVKFLNSLPQLLC